MNKQTQEALKMAIAAFERWEDTYKADCTEVINACKEALEQPAQEPVIIGVDFAEIHFKKMMIGFLKDKQICAFDNNKLIIQSWINELESKTNE
jgi:hypothetical protein